MTITAEAWREAVATLLLKFETVTVVLPDGSKAEKKVHETDPTPGQRCPKGMPRPGPLPALVEEADVAKAARTLVMTHNVETAGADLAHMARHAVVNAREHNAKGIALRDPVEESPGVTSLAVVLVL